jgi:thiol-disulfide isomerase/thioredoxin
MYIKVIIAFFLTALAVHADELLPTLKVGGDTFTNVTVTRVTATDIYFLSPSGLGNAKLIDLDPELQQHFRFNASKAVAVDQARAQANAQYKTQLASQPAVKPPDMSRESVPDAPEGLGIGQRFPDFNVNDLNGSPLSVSGARGKVLLVDFWATWCGPCRGEMPNVIAAYQKYHASGFDVIGVSLDEDRNSLTSYAATQGLAWPQYFDGQGWDNKLAKRYGVHSIPTNFLLDRNGIILGEGLRGGNLDAAVNAALANK